jgi:hypothetical protein
MMHIRRAVVDALQTQSDDALDHAASRWRGDAALHGLGQCAHHLPPGRASVQRPEGEGWPMVWMIVFGISIAAAIYILLW